VQQAWIYQSLYSRREIEFGAIDSSRPLGVRWTGWRKVRATPLAPDPPSMRSDGGSVSAGLRAPTVHAATWPGDYVEIVPAAPARMS
jgi:hypothetical protein